MFSASPQLQNKTKTQEAKLVKMKNSTFSFHPATTSQALSDSQGLAILFTICNAEFKHNFLLYQTTSSVATTSRLLRLVMLSVICRCRHPFHEFSSLVIWVMSVSCQGHIRVMSGSCHSWGSTLGSSCWSSWGSTCVGSQVGLIQG